jgi:photosystem II stability/assembly factor-like uncharacterized protein
MESQRPTTPPQPTSYIFQLAAPATFRRDVLRPCFSARATGLFRSSDGGRSWENAYASLNAREALPTTAIALAPDFEHEPTVFAGLNGAILCSQDGGNSWQRSRLPNPPPAVSALAISPGFSDDGIVFAGTNEDGVLVSSDRGNHWTAWNFGLLDLAILCLALSPGFSSDETLFAGAESGLFRSTNGGRAWKEVPLPIDYDAILSLAFSPNYAQDGTLFAGTENNGLQTSRDGGISWLPLKGLPSHEPVNLILLSSSARDILILHGGTPIKSADGGKTWKAWKGERMAGRNVTAILPPEAPGGKYLAGFEDGTIKSV